METESEQLVAGGKSLTDARLLEKKNSVIAPCCLICVEREAFD